MHSRDFIQLISLTAGAAMVSSFWLNSCNGAAAGKLVFLHYRDHMLDSKMLEGLLPDEEA